MAWGCPRLWSRCDGGTVCYMVIILTVLARVGVIGPLAVELMTKKGPAGFGLPGLSAESGYASAGDLV